jgi:hypothetical protein
MKKKAVIGVGLLSAVFMVSCGGSGEASGPGTSVKGNYSLTLALDDTKTTYLSPAVDDTSGIVAGIVIPPDTIAGQITLSYNGSGTLDNNIYGTIENSQVCFSEPVNKCFPLNINGTLTIGKPLDFSQQILQYKYEVPWIVLNPYEDEKFPYPSIGNNMTKVQVGGGVGSQTIFYYTLPQDTTDKDGGNIKYGDEINVYVTTTNTGTGGTGGTTTTFACSLSNPTDICTVSKSGQNVTIIFKNAPSSQDTVELEYSAYKYYNWNPNVDAKALNHLYNGQNTATVNANLFVRVRVTDGTYLDVSKPLQLQVVSRKENSNSGTNPTNPNPNPTNPTNPTPTNPTP